MKLENIYAVVWQDLGIPLSLKVSDSATAIQKAQDMADKAYHAHIALFDLKAVHLDTENNLHVLWRQNA